MGRFKFKGISLLIVLLITLSLFISGCSSEGNETETTQDTESTDNTQDDNISFEDESYIVDIDWLKENIEDEEILILDARGEDEYKKGHIPGAIAISWQEFSDMKGKPGDENWGTVLKGEELSQKLSEAGITDDKKIVVYSDTQKGWGEDGRIVWMLRRVGMDKPVMLDGGFNYWKSQGEEISKDPVERIASNTEVSSLDDQTNITTEELIEKKEQVKVIDVRSKKEFNGATDYGEPRGGYIPGAINIDFYEFLNKDGTLKTASEIKSILDENGIEKNDEIVTYCTAGIRSAHMQIVLDMLGYKDAKNYDQSFNAWAGNEDLEVVK